MQLFLHTNQSIAFVEKSALSVYCVENGNEKIIQFAFADLRPDVRNGILMADATMENVRTVRLKSLLSGSISTVCC